MLTRVVFALASVSLVLVACVTGEPPPPLPTVEDDAIPPKPGTDLGEPEVLTEEDVRDGIGDAPAPGKLGQRLDGGACSHACAVGQLRCATATTYQRCVTNARGCRVWAVAATCKQALPMPGCFAYQKACAGECSSACPKEGVVSCAGAREWQTCVRGTDQCLQVLKGACKSATLCADAPGYCKTGLGPM